MTVGDVLDRGLKLLLGRLPMYYAINLITTSPAIGLTLMLPFLARPSANPDPQSALIMAGAGLFVLVLTIIGAWIGAAAILRVVLNDFTGRPVSFGDAFSFALGRFGP